MIEDMARTKDREGWKAHDLDQDVLMPMWESYPTQLGKLMHPFG